MKPDILVFMSDQHGAWAMGGKNCPVSTPVLDKMRAEGVEFANTYTPCPLCVPARMAFLSGKMPGDTGILLNDDTLPDTTPTFLHSLAAAGYETVLAGRMHFVGADQRHGFTKRIAPDITPVTWNRPVEKLRQERGVFVPTYGAKGCTVLAGGGESPVLHYDQMVLKAALEYLKQPHEKPQFLLVGTYAPHFPYVAPKELYQKYRENAVLTTGFYDTPDYMNPFLKARQNHASEETALAAQSAYFGMIEQMDRQLGQIRQAFRDFCAKRGSQPVVCYLSDHGDELGERGIFGKWNFFERSSRVPFVLEAPNLPKGKRVKGLCSLLDVGPTLCHLAGAQPPESNGCDLIELLKRPVWPDRTVYSQLIEAEKDGGYRYAVMVRQKQYKWVRYHGCEEQDMLFDLEQDPNERQNRVSELADVAKRMEEAARKIADPNTVEAEQILHKKRADWFRAVEAAGEWNEDERWQEVPQSAKEYPEICVKGGTMPGTTDQKEKKA